MDFEVIFWVTFFFGGVILAIVLLLIRAIKADRQEARREREGSEPDRGPGGT